LHGLQRAGVSGTPSRRCRAGNGSLAAAGIAYWLFVSEQRQYLIGRDFRVLANLATQIDKISAVEAEVVLNAVAVTADDSDKRKAKWVGLRGKPFHAEDLKFEPVETRTASPRARPDYKYRFNGGTLTVPLWSDTPSRAQTATLRLLPVLEPMFIEKVGQGAFESILLGDQNGKVLAGAGEAAAQIRSSGLGILSPKGADGNACGSSTSPSRLGRRMSRSLTSTTHSSRSRAAAQTRQNGWCSSG